ncbi:mechanosensitive ion channel family protein [Desulfogranum mediterraneum]|uniref:mechanosensitive ion channel family protein n=1 Tax=Desulfogranum mediterraneum TaxID=160661 RepID=UPI00041578FF|nr:mechanosensitive ion channel family protein [Desulfogranum mediterraneum]
MRTRINVLTLWLLLIPALVCSSEPTSTVPAPATAQEQGQTVDQNQVQQTRETTEMLASLLELQHSLREQISISQKKLKNSSSAAEKAELEEEIAHLDKQLSESDNDFERIATGVEPAIFAEKKPETFSWKAEMASLAEPAIKELKRFTIKARQKSRLKDTIAELKNLSSAANEAVSQLQQVSKESSDPKVREEATALLPEWINIQKRLANKLELTELELLQLREDEESLVESSRQSMRDFFKNRGFYLIIALATFGGILIACKLLYRLIRLLLGKLQAKEGRRSFQVRLLDITFRFASLILAVIGLFYILYLAEDWFLLSMAIIFFIGIIWAVRQGLPRMWQQGRLMLNVGSVREGERLTLHGVPWRVASLNVFCRLENPAMELSLRVPIEDLVGMSSRPYHQEEPWFPCQKGDWVVVGSSSRARVVSLSHEQVELVQRGGKRIIYPTADFLSACPINLSRNFRLRVPFGVSYDLQDQVTTTIPATLKAYLEERLEEEGYDSHCLNLLVEFFQAGPSSLDLLIIADFKGQAADISSRLQRALQRWSVDCCTLNNWEIPFPQLTVHTPDSCTPGPESGPTATN